MAAFLSPLGPLRPDGGRLFHYGVLASGSVCAGLNERRRRRFPLLTSRQLGSNCSFTDGGSTLLVQGDAPETEVSVDLKSDKRLTWRRRAPPLMLAFSSFSVVPADVCVGEHCSDFFFIKIIFLPRRQFHAS